MAELYKELTWLSHELWDTYSPASAATKLDPLASRIGVSLVGIPACRA
jgi:hypothetical protein